MALIPPFFLDCVVAIGFSQPPAGPQYLATGFLYGQFLRPSPGGDGKDYRVFLVTNRHVLVGKKLSHVRFNPEGDLPARVFDLELLDDIGKPLWFAHADPDIDIAVARISVKQLEKEGIRFSWFRSDEHVADRAQCKASGLSEGDGVFVLGFPLGTVGEKRNFVIVRAGVVARVRDALAGYSKEFLLDASIFPGHSGGPVVLRPEALSIQGTNAIGRACLLGVVAGYVPYNDVAVSAQTQKPRVIFQENSGLAVAYPIDYLNEVIASIPIGELPAADATSPELEKS